MTGDTVATDGAVLINRTADQDTVGIVTTGTTNMGIGCCAGQGVVVTVSTTSCCYLNQQSVARGVDAVDTLPAVAPWIG